MAKASETDVWDQDPPGRRAGSTFVRTFNSKAAKTRVVRDDWDDDDDEEEEEPERDGGEIAIDRTKHCWHNETAPTPPSADMRASGVNADAESSVVWAEANKRAPMPELIVASASTGHVLPPAAFQPALRILKRPSPNTSVSNLSSVPMSSSSPGPASGPGSGAVSPAQRGTLAEREAQYQEARSRIFGVKEKLGTVEPVEPGPGRSAKGGR